MLRIALLLLGGAVLLGGCASKSPAPVDSSSGSSDGGRYSLKHDRYPDAPVDVSKVPDAVPRVEPLSRGGNRSPYNVLGKEYHVMDSALGYRQRGVASWYGEKFHGHDTSNGEVYDMYTMTAAHKSLPLPTFVRVTNVDNGRQVIVRVNDRGPFHDDRLIDLSYAAAARLDMLAHGTARVEVEAIDPRTWSTGRILASSASSTPAPVATVKATPLPASTPAPATSSHPAGAGRFLQVGAYSNADAAASVRDELARVAQGAAVSVKAIERQGAQLYRVLIGPLSAQVSAEELIAGVEAAGHRGAILVHYP